MNSNKIEYQDGVFVLPGPADVDDVRSCGRGVPLRADPQFAAQEINGGQAAMNAEFNKRLEALEAALIQREAMLAKAMNAFAEKVISVMVAAWGRMLEDQEKRYLTELRSTLWEIFEQQEAERKKNWENLVQSRGKNEPSWWARFFDNREQT